MSAINAQLKDMKPIYGLQEQAVFGKMKMDPGKRAQTQNTGEVSSLEWSFPNPLN
jgi:hypothetical protein